VIAMARVNYAYKPKDEVNSAKAMGYEMEISFKHAVEICRAIKGMKIDEAIKYLEEVVEMKRAIPFRKHKKKVPHRRGLEKWYAGRYPTKATKHIIKVLKNLKANAEYKGLDETHHKGFKKSESQCRIQGPRSGEACNHARPSKERKGAEKIHSKSFW